MAAAQCKDEKGKRTLASTRNAEELVAEARRGADLARALIEHINWMRAAGYDNEIVVDGEIWTVEVKRRSQAN